MIAKLSLLVLAAALATTTASWPESFEIVYSFTGGSDGSNPAAGVVSDKHGNLYGTTSGNVYELPASGGERTIYTFEGGKDANTPAARLLIRNRRLYGTSIVGGRHGGGTVFKIKANGREEVLHSFCSEPGCSDGQFPSASLLQDADGNLYGTARYGGAHSTQNRGGVIFKMAPGRAETVLYSFCAQPDCADGNDAANSIVRDVAGNIYGTTAGGGIDNPNCIDGCGTIFRLTPDGALTVLYSFCSQTNCSDGFDPLGGPVLDSTGNLYGSASFGGAIGCSHLGCGVIYRLAPDGTYSVLYAFKGGKQGQWPLGELAIDAGGNLYGAADGGTGGVLFEITAAGAEKTLHVFCQTDCSDGSNPTGTLLLQNGYLYGTTFGGGILGCGSFGCGVVFRLRPNG